MTHGERISAAMRLYWRRRKQRERSYDENQAAAVLMRCVVCGAEAFHTMPQIVCQRCRQQK